jgi:hypothetical protein
MHRLAIAMACTVTGCSFAFVKPPPANHQQLPMFDCTSGRLVPGLDVAWTVLQTLNLAIAASSSDAEWDDNFGGDAPFSRGTAIPLYAVLAGLGAAGAYYGFTKTAECRQARMELMMRAGGMQPGMQPGTWPPPPMQPTQPPPDPYTPTPGPPAPY